MEMVSFHGLDVNPYRPHFEPIILGNLSCFTHIALLLIS